jgi:hypothetical protein
VGGGVVVVAGGARAGCVGGVRVAVAVRPVLVVSGEENEPRLHETPLRQVQEVRRHWQPPGDRLEDSPPGPALGSEIPQQPQGETVSHVALFVIVLLIIGNVGKKAKF